MGLIDTFFITDENGNLIFEHIVNHSSPTYSYVHSQLTNHNGNSFAPITEIDSKWRVACNKVDKLYLIAVGSIESPDVEVYSDEENDDETDNDDNDEQIDKASAKGSTAVVNMPFNPSIYVQFFRDFTLIAEAFMEESHLTAENVVRYSYRLAMILQEMIDASYPYITDLNQLRELIPGSGIIKKLINTTKQLQETATTSFQEMKRNGQFSRPVSSNKEEYSIFEKSDNPVPWREVGLKYARNEMFVDIIEKFDYVISMSSLLGKSYKSEFNIGSAYYDLQGNSINKSVGNIYSLKNVIPSTASIQGQIQFRSSLTGMPKIRLVLDNSHHNMGIPSLHKCVDLATWLSSKNCLEFIPPDEKFTLMTYHLNLIQEAGQYQDTYRAQNQGLVDTQLISGIGKNKNEFEINIKTLTKPSVESIDNLIIDITLPTDDSYTIKPIRITHGTLDRKDDDHYQWKFESQLPLGMSSTLKGEIRLNNEDEEIKPLQPRSIHISYKNRGSLPSGITVRSVNVVSGMPEMIKPFKGVKYTTVTGDYTIY